MRALSLLLASCVLSTASAGVFRNCKEAATAGYQDIKQSSVYYDPALDRDHDGIACESNGNDAPYRYDPSKPFVVPNVDTSPQQGSSTPMVSVTYHLASPEAPDLAGLDLYRVIEVRDDGTIILNRDYQDSPARLLGLTLTDKMKLTAVAWLRMVMPVNSYIFVEFDAERKGPDRALLIYVWLDRQLVNAQGLIQGLFSLDPKYNGKYLKNLQAAETMAKDEGWGMWAK